MGRLFFFPVVFFFSKLVVTFFVYCYGIVIVLNFLLIRPRSHYWTFFVFFKWKICQLVAYKLSATPILKLAKFKGADVLPRILKASKFVTSRKQLCFFFFFNHLAIIVRKTCVDKISMSLWPSVFVWRETRNLSDAFIRLSDSYHGNELGYWRQFGEQSASTSTTPSIRIIEASKSGASCNQKDRQEKKESEVRYMIPTSNYDSTGRRDLGDFDQGWFRKPALFRRSLRLLRLKADTSRMKTCW